VRHCCAGPLITYYERKTKTGKGSKTYVAKRLYLDLLHDDTVADPDGEVYHHFEFFEAGFLILIQLLTRLGS